MGDTTNGCGGVGALLEAYRSERATPRDVTLAARERAASATDSEWICVASPEFVSSQLDKLAKLDANSSLYGVPFAVKDNIDVAGLPTTAACPKYRYTPTKSADAVQRLLDAGAIVIGKTNLDQFATGLVGTRSPFGAPSSALDANYISGGSSSGSAVVVSRGVVAFSLGTDTAGSGRVPAGFNNIVGLKPTLGRVSTEGVVPACATLDCVSVFALSASDAACVLRVIETGRDEHSTNPHDTTPTLLGPREFRELRLGYPVDFKSKLSDSYASAMASALVDVERMMKTKPMPVDFSVPHQVAPHLYDEWVAERFVVLEDLLTEDEAAVEDVVRSIVLRAKTFSAADGFKARYKVQKLAKRADRIWDHVDVLLVPTTPCHPSKVEVSDDPVRVNSRLGTYTNFVNLLGWSAVALPTSILAPSGLPFGVTMIAPGWCDAALLSLGAKWQSCIAPEVPFGAPSAGIRGVVVDLPPQMPLSQSELEIAVVGAHLKGMALHYQLEERACRFLYHAKTSKKYSLYELSGAQPRKPGLVRQEGGGSEISLEVYAMPESAVGSFFALIPHPLGLGSVELSDGKWVRSFICEGSGVVGARDISEFGGWRNFMNA